MIKVLVDEKITKTSFSRFFSWINSIILNQEAGARNNHSARKNILRKMPQCNHDKPR